MRRLMLAVTASAIWIAAAGLTPATVESPYGSWELVKTVRVGVSYEIIMTIEAERVRMTSRCSDRDHAVEVEVSSAAEVTETELRIIGSDRAEKEHSPGYLRCAAAIRPATLGYELREGKLVLNDPERPKPMVLSRTAL